MRVIKQKDYNIDEIVTALRGGQTIVYPTETCYGLGCDATNQEAVDKIFQIKGRREDKPLLMIVPNTEMIQEYAECPPELFAIEQKYWPGALTVILPAKKDSGLASGVISRDGMIAVRVSSYPLAHAIVERLGKPLVSTSANRAGEENPYDVETVLGSFEDQKHQPDVVIDGGVLPVIKPSTVVSIVGDELKVLRQGDVAVEIK